MILAIIFAIINRLRGWDSKYSLWHGKYPCAVYLGIITGFYSGDYIIGLIVTLGWILWAIWGWGDYFDFSPKKNNENKFIDDFVGAHIESGWLNDLASMSLRGMFIFPMFIALSVYILSPYPFLLGLGACLQGLFYFIGHKLWPDMSGRSTVFGEVTTGALHGMLLSMAL